jgi:hypothetical protein
VWPTKGIQDGPCMYVALTVFSRKSSYLWPENIQGSHLSTTQLSLSLKWQGTAWEQKTKQRWWCIFNTKEPH